MAKKANKVEAPAKAASFEELVKEKISLGLSKAQAESVAKRQLERDKPSEAPVNTEAEDNQPND